MLLISRRAMAVSDRIAVMKNGVIQHIGTPKNIYQRPANSFVASFIGRSNTVEGKIVKKDGKCYLKLVNFEVEMKNILEKYQIDQDVLVSIRPEELLMSDEETMLYAFIDDCVFLGLNTHYFMHFEDGNEVVSIQESVIGENYKKGDKVYLKINEQKINIFTKDGSVNILKGVVNDNEIQ